MALHHSIYRMPFSSKYSPSFRSVRHTTVAVPLKLLIKLASVAGQFFCETASAQLSYFTLHILLIAYRGVSVESAIAKCDGASNVDVNRTTKTISTIILHQRTTLEGGGRAQHTSTAACSRAADSVEAAPGPEGVNMYKRAQRGCMEGGTVRCCCTVWRDTIH